ncbi:MAG: hypothetical protein LUG60_00790 [Erysipelotrichaceae bacterium]|nr:hypothetical protein [Erysipelotrichaceae bacterium]
MFNQIIYTRCKPGRNIENLGEEDHNDGYKIRSFSKEIYDVLDDNEIQLLSKQYIKLKNESKTGSKQGLIDSFEYIPLHHVSAFAYQHPRKPDEEKRPGNFIKHYFVGNIDNYPITYMNKELYTYTQLPANHYYEENETSEFLPNVELTSSLPFTIDEIQSFYQQHSEIINKAISFIIAQQYSEDKKILIIKDDSEHVLKWIACITCALPLELSKKISFSTNANIEKSNPSSFQYCLDQGNHYVKYNNNPDLSKHYLFDIIGISPLSPSSTSFKSMANSPFVIIDASTNETDFEIEINENYLSYACQYNLKDFNEILKYFNHYDFKDIYEVYEIYQHLFKEESIKQCDYDSLVKYIQLVQKYMIVGSMLEKNLSVEVYKAYSKWYQEDMNNQYQLLSYIYQTSLTSQNISYQQKVLQMICQYVDITMDYTKIVVHNVKTLWNFIQKDASLYQTIGDYYFNESQITSYIQGLTDIDEEIAVDVGMVMIDLFNDYLQGIGLNKVLLDNHQDWTNYLYNLYVLVLSEGLPSDATHLVSGYDEEVMNLLTMKFSKNKGSKAPVTKNWIYLYGSTINMDDLYHQCESMLKSGVHSDAVELLITTYMEKQQQTNQELLKSFKLLFDYLDNDKSVGDTFFEKYMEIVNQSKNKYKETIALLNFVRKEEFPQSIQRNLAIKVDNMLPIISESHSDEQFIRDYYEWCKPLKEIGQNTLKALYGLDVKDVRASNLDKFIAKVSNHQLSIKANEKAYLDLYIQNIAKLIESPDTLNDALNMFQVDDAIKAYMLEQYFAIIAKRTKKDMYALHTLASYYVISTYDKDMTNYASSQGKLILAEHFNKEVWIDYLDHIKNEKMKNKIIELYHEISQLNDSIKPTDKLRKGFKKLFGKK